MSSYQSFLASNFPYRQSGMLFKHFQTISLVLNKLSCSPSNIQDFDGFCPKLQNHKLDLTPPQTVCQCLNFDVYETVDVKKIHHTFCPVHQRRHPRMHRHLPNKSPGQKSSWPSRVPDSWTYGQVICGKWQQLTAKVAETISIDAD